jgi:hypothetical protein
MNGVSWLSRNPLAVSGGIGRVFAVQQARIWQLLLCSWGTTIGYYHRKLIQGAGFAVCAFALPYLGYLGVVSVDTSLHLRRTATTLWPNGRRWRPLSTAS